MCVCVCVCQISNSPYRGIPGFVDDDIVRRRMAVRKAKKPVRNVGSVGWMVCKQSNHYGIASYYVIIASEQGEF